MKKEKKNSRSSKVQSMRRSSDLAKQHRGIGIKAVAAAAQQKKGGDPMNETKQTRDFIDKGNARHC